MKFLGEQIDVDDEKIVVRCFGRNQSLRWSDIMAVQAEKVDKVTYDETYIVLTDSKGQSVSVGELDGAFSNIESKCQRLLQGFWDNWRPYLETTSAGTRVDLWTRR